MSFVAKVIDFSAAFLCFVKVRVELELFPSVTHATAVLKWTAIFVVLRVFLA